MVILLSGWSPYGLDPLLVGAASGLVLMLVAVTSALEVLLVVASLALVLLLVGVSLDSASASGLERVGASLSSVLLFSFHLRLALLAAMLLFKLVFLVLIVEWPALSKTLTIAKGTLSDTTNCFT